MNPMDLELIGKVLAPFKPGRVVIRRPTDDMPSFYVRVLVSNGTTRVFVAGYGATLESAIDELMTSGLQAARDRLIASGTLEAR